MIKKSHLDLIMNLKFIIIPIGSLKWSYHMPTGFPIDLFRLIWEFQIYHSFDCVFFFFLFRNLKWTIKSYFNHSNQLRKLYIFQSLLLVIYRGRYSNQVDYKFIILHSVFSLRNPLVRFYIIFCENC